MAENVDENAATAKPDQHDQMNTSNA